MKRIILSVAALLLMHVLQAQPVKRLIKVKEVTRIEEILSADDMEGRRTFTPGIEKAAVFIENEFKKIGLKTFNGATNYRQNFMMYQSINIDKKVIINDQRIEDSLVVSFSFDPQVKFTEKTGVEVVKISAGDKFGQKFYQYYQSKKDLLVIVDSSFTSRLAAIKKRDRIVAEPTKNTVVFVFGVTDATTFSVELNNNVVNKSLTNLIGIIPGKTKRDEYVIFSGHYDHLGVGAPQEGLPTNDTDTIYNGANDDAAGTTAVIMLAKYFKRRNNNKRTIIFTTFAAEEIGGFGSQYFSKQLKPEKVAAMFNIEMIGTESKWGRNSAYITGYEKSNMGEILQKNLTGSLFTFHPDPYPTEQLFYRSDNATLALLGVPAHTISTSKMDSEPNYHKVSDEIETLDLNNMAAVIRAIALSATTIISGEDSPTRVDINKLK